MNNMNNNATPSSIPISIPQAPTDLRLPAPTYHRTCIPRVPGDVGGEGSWVPTGSIGEFQAKEVYGDNNVATMATPAVDQVKVDKVEELEETISEHEDEIAPNFDLSGEIARGRHVPLKRVFCVWPETQIRRGLIFDKGRWIESRGKWLKEV
ncbi:hypothetical protein BKA70DRAFT_793800 [Coprinopsis sp. MPI-PUGE-AT-0042]|nr:hypothetical protein BKA70DRAFT_793800 [Coprinopsis sp. MPI-PUGE-AT-0042]